MLDGTMRRKQRKIKIRSSNKGINDMWFATLQTLKETILDRALLVQDSSACVFVKAAAKGVKQRATCSAEELPLVRKSSEQSLVD